MAFDPNRNIARMDVVGETGVHVLGRYTTEPGGPGGIRTHVLSAREITDFDRPILLKG